MTRDFVVTVKDSDSFGVALFVSCGVRDNPGVVACQYVEQVAPGRGWVATKVRDVQGLGPVRELDQGGQLAL